MNTAAAMAPTQVADTHHGWRSPVLDWAERAAVLTLYGWLVARIVVGYSRSRGTGESCLVGLRRAGSRTDLDPPDDARRLATPGRLGTGFFGHVGCRCWSVPGSGGPCSQLP